MLASKPTLLVISEAFFMRASFPVDLQFALSLEPFASAGSLKPKHAGSVRLISGLENMASKFLMLTSRRSLMALHAIERTRPADLSSVHVLLKSEYEDSRTSPTLKSRRTG